MIKSLPLAALAATAASCLWAPAALAATDVTFCNKTGSKVFIAIAHLDEATQKWRLTAWHNAAPGGCRSVGKLRTGLFYYFAEKEGRKIYWPAQAQVDKNFCVPVAKVSRVMTGGTCVPGERSLGFKGMVPNAGKYTVNLI